MPELPEVEVTRLGIEQYLLNNTVTRVAVHSPKLRSFVPDHLDALLTGQPVRTLQRRGKYLVLGFPSGYLLLHLGMTGHLRIVPQGRPPGKHDHFDLEVHSGHMLRLNDTRKFGSLHWTEEEPLQHPLLASIGPEPLTEDFSGTYLFERSRRRNVAMQRFLMDASVVAGVGNIYAAESLFRCRMLPTTVASSLSRERCEEVVAAVKAVLGGSIAAGRAVMDFRHDGGAALAYFPQELFVYDREGEPCRACGDPVKRTRLGTRSSYFCATCQQ